MARMSDCPSPLGTICVDLDCPLHYPNGLEGHRHDSRMRGPHTSNRKLVFAENLRNVTCGICLEWSRKRENNGN